MRQILRATFDTWKLPNGGTIPGEFTIRLEPSSFGPFKFEARLEPTREPFYERGKMLSFPESKLAEGKARIAAMFQKQLTDWQ